MNRLSLFILFFISSGSLCAQHNWTKVKDELVFRNPPFAQCHAATLVEAAPGVVLLACFGGSGEGKPDVAIWGGQLGPSGISFPVKWADGARNDSMRFAAWNPILFKNPMGHLSLYYKVGPNPRTWWGLEKTSLDSGLTWLAAKFFPAPFLGPIKNKPIQLPTGVILSPSSVENENGRWQAHIERSVDSGKSWRFVPVDTASAIAVIQPTLLLHADGRVQALCRSNTGFIMQSWSADGGESWSAFTPTQLPNPNAGIDAVTLRDGRHLLVYNPAKPGAQWYNGRSELRAAVSANGLLWQDVAVLEKGTTQEYSYPAVIETSDGRVHIVYTYDRKNLKHVVLQPR